MTATQMAPPIVRKTGVVAVATPRWPHWTEFCTEIISDGIMKPIPSPTMPPATSM